MSRMATAPPLPATAEATYGNTSPALTSSVVMRFVRVSRNLQPTKLNSLEDTWGTQVFAPEPGLQDQQ